MALKVDDREEEAELDDQEQGCHHYFHEEADPSVEDGFAFVQRIELVQMVINLLQTDDEEERDLEREHKAWAVKNCPECGASRAQGEA